GPVEGATVCAYLPGTTVYQSVGITDANGQISLPLALTAAGNLKLTVVKQNYKPVVDSLDVIQAAVAVGYQSHTVDDDGSGTSSGDGDGFINPGETVEIPLVFKNYGNSTTATSVNCVATENDPYITLGDNQETFPNLAPGASGNSVDDLDLTVAADCPDGHVIHLNLFNASGQGTWPGGFDLLVRSFHLNLTAAVVGGTDTLLTAGETADWNLTVRNAGLKTAANPTATLTSLSGYITVNDGQASLSTLAPGAVGSTSANGFNLTAALNTPPGHVALMRVVYSANGAAQADTIPLQVGSKSITDPTGPDEYGYYCFDNGDVNYAQCPTYQWVEISGSGGGTSLSLNDPYENQDVSTNVYLPFTFRFYGQETNRITVCTNGWISTTADPSYSDFRNYPIPSAPGPSGHICPFWDDLVTSPGNVWVKYDTAGHRFIIEWYQMNRLYSSSAQETFQIILYDPAYYPTPTGDGEIVFQYYNIVEVNGPGDDNPYSTVGIERHDHHDGIEVAYWNSYDDPATAHLQNGRAYKFTTAIEYLVPGTGIDITLTPISPPLTVPASGGSFSFDAQVQNLGSVMVGFDAWIMQRQPSGVWQGPMLGPLALTLPAGGNVTRQRIQNVPGTAAAGAYTYVGYVGDYPGLKQDSSYFSYTKLTTGDGEWVSDWTNWGESFEPYLTKVELAAVPEAYNLKQNYPNPFNPETAIGYRLPASGRVHLRVYDTAGREVATLVNGWQEAGVYQVTFDGSGLASGVYLVRMEAGDFTATQKMVLLK
ncbi:MAG: T9SS C-terminal target domain-containing protein, partial [Candidatus Zixiibacteriota bacterium]